MEKLGDTLVNHFDGIAAYCDHPVRFGLVESLNTTIKAVLRRARGMRHEPYGRVRGDAGEVDAAGAEFDKEEHVWERPKLCVRG